MLRGSMGENAMSIPNSVPIPVVGITQDDGITLQEYAGNKKKEFRIYNPIEDGTLREGYARMSGTSMAYVLFHLCICLQ